MKSERLDGSTALGVSPRAQLEPVPLGRPDLLRSDAAEPEE